MQCARHLGQESWVPEADWADHGAELQGPGQCGYDSKAGPALWGVDAPPVVRGEEVVGTEEVSETEVLGETRRRNQLVHRHSELGLQHDAAVLD